MPVDFKQVQEAVERVLAMIASLDDEEHFVLHSDAVIVRDLLARAKAAEAALRAHSPCLNTYAGAYAYAYGGTPAPLPEPPAQHTAAAEAREEGR